MQKKYREINATFLNHTINDMMFSRKKSRILPQKHYNHVFIIFLAKFREINLFTQIKSVSFTDFFPNKSNERISCIFLTSC